MDTKKQLLEAEKQQGSADGWRVLAKDVGVAVFTCPGAGSALKIKTCMALTGIHPDTCLSVLTNITDRSKWDTNFQEARVIQQINKQQRYVYYSSQGRDGVKPRDMVELMTVSVHDKDAGQSAHVIVNQNATHEEAPVRDDRSRACLVSGGSVIRHHPRQRGSTHLMFLFQYNFGEDIPLALVSALAGRESKRFHSRLKQQCNQVQVKGAVATANAASLPVPAGFRTHKQRSRAAGAHGEDTNVASAVGSSVKNYNIKSRRRCSMDSAAVKSRAKLEQEIEELGLRQCKMGQQWYASPQCLPKVLPCFHTFGEPWLTKQESSKVVFCPQCGAQAQLTDGAEMLPTSAAACHLCQIDLEPPKEPVDEWHKNCVDMLDENKRSINEAQLDSRRIHEANKARSVNVKDEIVQFFEEARQMLERRETELLQQVDQVVAGMEVAATDLDTRHERRLGQINRARNYMDHCPDNFKAAQTQLLL